MTPPSTVKVALISAGALPLVPGNVTLILNATSVLSPDITINCTTFAKLGVPYVTVASRKPVAPRKSVTITFKKVPRSYREGVIVLVDSGCAPNPPIAGDRAISFYFNK